jgi:hypothetical protein
LTVGAVLASLEPTEPFAAQQAFVRPQVAVAGALRRVARVVDPLLLDPSCHPDLETVLALPLASSAAGLLAAAPPLVSMPTAPEEDSSAARPVPASAL